MVTSSQDAPAEKCPIQDLMEIIADKWTPAVIYYLSLGTQRTGNLGRVIPGISKKMLVQTLRNLESWGLVERTVYREVPPRVEYALTPLGWRFNEPLELLCEWSEANAPIVEQVTARRTERPA